MKNELDPVCDCNASLVKVLFLFSRKIEMAGSVGKYTEKMLYASLSTCAAIIQNGTE